MVAVKFDEYSSTVCAVTVGNDCRNGRFWSAVISRSWLFSKPCSSWAARSWPSVRCNRSFCAWTDP